MTSIEQVRALGEYSVEIETKGPNALLPSAIASILMMDRDWSDAHHVADVHDYASGADTYSATHANGTGPYKLVSRETDLRTVLVANESYWGKSLFPLHFSRIVFTPIKNPATRVAALLSGDVDFIQDVPVQDLERVRRSQGLDIRTAPQNRVIFLGMNLGDPDLRHDNVEGRNPFADLRVRRAISLAIDRSAIQNSVMRGQSVPVGMIATPFVNGWQDDLGAPPETDVPLAKALLTEAGYGDGFRVTLDCPNDRYVNDEAICQSIVGMLARIGIDVHLSAVPKAQHFPKIGKLETDFYLLGWEAPTFDSEVIFNFLVHTRDRQHGIWNGTRYSNPELDTKIRGLTSEIDLSQRNRDIADIWDVVNETQPYIPLHTQVLNWGIRSDIETVVSPDNEARFKYFARK